MLCLSGTFRLFLQRLNNCPKITRMIAFMSAFGIAYGDSSRTVTKQLLWNYNWNCIYVSNCFGTITGIAFMSAQFMKRFSIIHQCLRFYMFLHNGICCNLLADIFQRFPIDSSNQYILGVSLCLC